MDIGGSGISQGGGEVFIHGAGTPLIQFGESVVGAPVLELDGVAREIRRLESTLAEFRKTHEADVIAILDDVAEVHTEQSSFMVKINASIESNEEVLLKALIEQQRIYLEALGIINRYIVEMEARLHEHIHSERLWIRFTKWLRSIFNVS